MKFVALLALLVPVIALTDPLPVRSHPAHQAFFDTLSVYCGKAFAGKVTTDTAPSDAFAGKRLVVHFRECTDTLLTMPFHVGDNRSRTWLLSRTGSGLVLKHDHRHADGSTDKVTYYGGITTEPGFAQAQAFPADSYTRHMFAEQGLPQSLNNTWKLFIYPDTLSYQLVREGRAFQVDFDLTKPVATPPAPWGWE